MRAGVSRAPYILLLLIVGCAKNADSGYDPRDDAHGSYIEYEVNHFVRVLPAKGLNMRSKPDVKATVVATIPHPVQFRLLGRSSQTVRLDGIAGHWSYASYFPRASTGLPQKSIEGWVFEPYTGPQDYPVTDWLAESFTGGCLGVGCFVCGSKVFDPGGTFWDSAYCDAPVFKGKWWRDGETIRACMTSSCNSDSEGDIVFVKANDIISFSCVTEVCKKAHPSTESFAKWIYWEPHDFGRSQ